MNRIITGEKDRLTLRKRERERERKREKKKERKINGLQARHNFGFVHCLEIKKKL